MPCLLDRVLTSSFELVHGACPDYCNLFCLFSAGYFVHTQDGGRERTTMEAQSMQCITVGWSNNSNAMEFYCPFNKQIYTTVSYHLDKSRHMATYPPGTEVTFVQRDGVHIWGSIISVPIKCSLSAPASSPSLCYTICLVNGTIKKVSLSAMPTIMHTPDDHPPSQTSIFSFPLGLEMIRKLPLRCMACVNLENFNRMMIIGALLPTMRNQLSLHPILCTRTRQC
eukprot:6155946-Ditylum_brightwellii.AAC.1